MKNINFKRIYNRTRQLLVSPDKEWRDIAEEYILGKDIFRTYVFPLVVATSGIIMLLGLLSYRPLQALGLSLIHLAAVPAGIWLAYLITREYLANKCSEAGSLALKLTVYSSALFIVFHGAGIALGNGFLSQLLTLLSFIFIRTLYIGINRISGLQANYKTNLLVITGLSIICIPIIISHLLMIVFGISILNV